MSGVVIAYNRVVYRIIKKDINLWPNMQINCEKLGVFNTKFSTRKYICWRSCFYSGKRSLER